MQEYLSHYDKWHLPLEVAEGHVSCVHFLQQNYPCTDMATDLNTAKAIGQTNIFLFIDAERLRLLTTLTTPLPPQNEAGVPPFYL